MLKHMNVHAGGVVDGHTGKTEEGGAGAHWVRFERTHGERSGCV